LNFGYWLFLEVSMDEKKNYLGIDWGAADVGVALAHAETRVAMAYMTLHNDEQLLEKLLEIIVREDIGTVVIGVPTHSALRSEAGRHSHVNHEAVEYEGEKLGRLIADAVSGIQIAYQNEMFTTKMAQANLIERGMKQVSKHDDEEAAHIILEEWLEHQGERFL
jgi:RNase H-fold protein (predicted Holliday junction resolvase)